MYFFLPNVQKYKSGFEKENKAKKRKKKFDASITISARDKNKINDIRKYHSINVFMWVPHMLLYIRIITH